MAINMYIFSIQGRKLLDLVESIFLMKIEEDVE